MIPKFSVVCPYVIYLSCFLFFGCKKEQLETEMRPLNYASSVTLTEYAYDVLNVNGYIGRLLTARPDVKPFLRKVDSEYLLIRNDSLLLSKKGIDKARTLKVLDFPLFLKTDSITYRKDMRIVFNEFIRNKVVAHRGSWKISDLPENSVASLERSIALNCEASEFDVWMTADKILVVCHDASYYGMNIEEMTYSELSKVKLSNGEALPTLEVFLNKITKQRKTKGFLEIKSSSLGNWRNDEITDSVVNKVHRLKAQAWIYYISFGYDILKRVLSNDPGAKVVYLSSDKSLYDIGSARFSGIAYEYRAYLANDRIIRDALSRNLYVGTFTVNDHSMLSQMLARNVSSITTDVPEELLKLISERESDQIRNRSRKVK